MGALICSGYCPFGLCRGKKRAMGSFLNRLFQPQTAGSWLLAKINLDSGKDKALGLSTEIPDTE
jgi:hypothetical protein